MKDKLTFIFFVTTYITSLVTAQSGTNRTKTVLIPCVDDSDCVNLENAKCLPMNGNDVVKTCQCEKSQVCKERNFKIVTQILENCSHEHECQVEKSTCLENKCVCINGTVSSADRKRCLTISSGIGDSCEDSIQCYTRIPHSGCHDNKCACQQQMHEYNGSCYRNVELGQPCQHEGECSRAEFAECKHSTCSCIPHGYVQSTSTNKCLPVGDKFGSPCKEDLQCKEALGGAGVCVEGSCKCKELYQLKNETNKCVRDLLLGEKCETHSDCHGPEEGPTRSECILGECKCKYDYIEVDGFCTSDAPTPFYSLQEKGVLLIFSFLICHFAVNV